MINRNFTGTLNGNSYENGKESVYRGTDDRIYYNLQLSGKNYSTASLPPIGTTLPIQSANFNNSYSQPILNKPDDYYLSVVRFQIPTQHIPVFIPDILNPSVNVNTTVYSVSISYNGNTVQNYVNWIPKNTSVNSSNPYYYWGYDYSSFIAMINTSLTTCFNSISTPSGSLPPYFVFDPISRLISLVAQAAFYDSELNNSYSGITVYCNTPLLILLDGLPNIKIGTNTVNGLDFQFRFISSDATLYNPPKLTATTPPAYIKMTQEFQCLANWNCFKSLQIVSTSMPITREFLPINSGSTLSSVSILADFIPLLGDNNTAATSIEYSPAGPYHLINLDGQVPIQRIDIQVFWTDTYGNQYILEVPYNQVFSLKLCFIKRTTFTS